MHSIALELIKYQNNDKFAEKLSAIVDNIYTEIDNNLYKDNKALIEKSSSIKKIESLIKSRFNLNMVLDKELHVYYPAAIIPFLSDNLTSIDQLNRIDYASIKEMLSGNIFKHIKDIEKEREKYLQRIHNRKGSVDLKNARVSGYLADVKHYLIIDFFSLKDLDLTPGETAAVILHEIGHAFVGLETHHRLESTNSTIADIVDNINNNKPDKAVYIFKRHFSSADLENTSLNNNKEITDFYGKLANAYIGEIKSQFVNSKYDETNFENLADSFAVRMNVGQDLTTALHKLHTKYGAIIPNSKVLYGILMFIDILVCIAILLLLGPIGAVLLIFFIMFLYGSSSEHMTYDFPIERYNRIKNGIVNNLKNLDLPKDVAKALLAQYSFISKIIEDSDYFKSSLHVVSDFILPSNRSNNYYIHLQQTIENNLNNILFVKSAQLNVD